SPASRLRRSGPTALATRRLLLLPRAASVENLSHGSESAIGQTPVSRTALAVYLLALSRYRCHQQRRRAGDASRRDRRQNLGRQPQRSGPRGAKNLNERVAHLLSARQRRL